MMGSLAWLENLSAFQAGVALTVVEAIGDRSAKLNGPVPVYLAYAGLAFMLPHVLKKNPLGLTNGYWNACTNITGLVIGAYYGEQLESQQIAGLVLMSVGFVLLGSGKQTL